MKKIKFIPAFVRHFGWFLIGAIISAAACTYFFGLGFIIVPILMIAVSAQAFKVKEWGFGTGCLGGIGVYVWLMIFVV